MAFSEELSAIASRCRNYIRTGKISLYSETLKEMAELFRRNNCIEDCLKMLVISFYIDLSGFSRAPYIDHASADVIYRVIAADEISVQELERIYFEVVQPDMISKHALSVNDSWCLLRLCTEGKVEQAEYVLSKI